MFNNWIAISWEAARLGWEAQSVIMLRMMKLAMGGAPSRVVPASHLLRRINPIVMQVLADLREKLAPFYSDIGRPSIDPELMIRMLIVGYCYGIRFERRLCEEVELHLAYRGSA